jgi:hypothetical protein
MRQLTTIGVCAVLLLTLKGESHALLSGVYRCVSPVGGAFGMNVIHYNPNGNAQVVRRIRGFDGSGQLYFDSGPIALSIPPRAAVGSGVPPPSTDVEDVQIVASWTQGINAARPIVKVETFFVNPSGDLTMTRNTCP